MKRVVTIFAGLLLSAHVNAEVVIDIPSIAGKGKQEVSKLIGTPTSCKASKYGEKCQYQKAETEIVFINGKADWITVEGIDNIPFKNETLAKLGLKPKPPTFSNDFTKRWEPYQGLRSVSLFKGGTNSDYAYIKAFTK